MIDIDRPASQVFCNRPIYRGSDYKVEIEVAEFDPDTGSEQPIDLSGYEAEVFIGVDGFRLPCSVSGSVIKIVISCQEQTRLPNPRSGSIHLPVELHIHGNERHLILIRDIVPLYGNLGGCCG